MEDVENIDENIEQKFKSAFMGDKKDAKMTSEDFGFLKKRVRVNNVEKNVLIYSLEQDEIDAKRKGKKYL